MEKTNGEKRYKIEKIESGAKNVVLFEGARAAMSLGLIALGLTTFVVCDTDSIVKNFPVLGGILEYSILAIDFISAMMIVGNIMNLGELGHIVKKREKEGEESLDFNELKFSEHSLHDMDDTNGPLKNVILNGFFKEENEDTSKRRQK